MLYLTVLDPDQGERTYSCYGPLDIVFTTLDKLVTDGQPILRAQLLHKRQHIDLPVDRFDVQSLVRSTEQLEQQWKAILAEPVTRHRLTKLRLIQRLNRWLSFYQQSLEFSRGHIDKIRITLDRVHRSRLNPGQQRQLIGHFEDQIAHEELNMTRMAGQLEETQRRLQVVTESLIRS